MKALSPARVKEVRIDDQTGTATVIVPDYQLSLAIGKEGQNARLAARLTGWHVDIKSETEMADEEADQGEEWAQGEWVVDPESGEQVWRARRGRPGRVGRAVGLPCPARPTPPPRWSRRRPRSRLRSRRPRRPTD